MTESKDESLPDPVLVSVALPPGTFDHTNVVGAKVLHAAVLPVVVGLAIRLVEGTFSMGRFAEAWPVTVLFVFAYLGAWSLNSALERYPFVGQVEAAFLSASFAFVPVGLVLYSLLGSSLWMIAVVAGGGGLAVYLVDQFFHQFRESHLVVIPGGVSYRLLSAPGVTPMKDVRLDSVDVDGIVVDLHSSQAAYQQVIAQHGLTEVPTHHAGYLYELLTARVLLGEDCRTELNVSERQYYPHVKRASDIVLLAISLPLTAPILVVASLMLWLESGGAVLSWDERIGQHGDPFQMAKFRGVDAGDGQENATSIDQFVQKLRIAELPKLWNVLTGDMSLIGPRPKPLNFSPELFEKETLLEYRHYVRPGITGWAQVTHGFAVDEARRELEHDLYYVKHRSAALDLLIIYLTLKNVLSGFGA
ncbi:lipopolysaccharide/colanic/teichoic acid biosynthesis glycosyltransferase [Salinibacter ruber]|uniref:sugar transferase n=1 Tax=Salinibacter ruber TaxID=146919 RepID=UPI00216A6B83|nr:sugar transferase [Salinibacter ruber]MCS3632478.1 lipopolysaccharide/colanic/teichoic acid biosynthesis glycosyltransferase [Salinibacter ruber]